jgi:hypothetical protein
MSSQGRRHHITASLRAGVIISRHLSGQASSYHGISRSHAHAGFYLVLVDALGEFAAEYPVLCHHHTQALQRPPRACNLFVNSACQDFLQGALMRKRRSMLSRMLFDHLLLTSSSYQAKKPFHLDMIVPEIPVRIPKHFTKYPYLRPDHARLCLVG